MKVIDNFLPYYQFNKLESFLMGDDFPWFYNDGIVSWDDGRYQFTHTFYDMRAPWNGGTVYFSSVIEPILYNFGVTKLHRVKANLRGKSWFNRGSVYHRDLDNVTTAILYLNTNNGYTKFKKGGKVKSIANRAVIFDSNLEHMGYTCTNEKRRVVVNFNYEG